MKPHLESPDHPGGVGRGMTALKFMISRILGLGLAPPRFQIGQQESLAFARQMVYPSDLHPRALDAIYRKSAVRRRGSVLLDHDVPESGEAPDQDFYLPAVSAEVLGPSTATRNAIFYREGLPLAIRAAKQAMLDAEVQPQQVTHLVVVTCTGFQSPGIDVGLIRSLALSPETQRVQVGFMGCHGAINGLRTALGWTSSDPAARVLIVCVELCSIHFQYGWETDHVVSNAIFADGAAAVIVGGDDDTDVDRGSGGDQEGPIGKRQRPQLVATGSCLVPDSEASMTWQIGDHGFKMTLSAEVPDRIRAELPGFLTRWLAKSGLKLDQIGGWAVHPGGPRILTAVQDCLGLSDEQLSDSRGVLADHGNMSSPTMLFIIQRFLKVDRPRPWVMLGFGPGLEVEVALLR